jgi:hypothetical protein
MRARCAMRRTVSASTAIENSGNPTTFASL